MKLWESLEPAEKRKIRRAGGDIVSVKQRLSSKQAIHSEMRKIEGRNKTKFCFHFTCSNPKCCDLKYPTYYNLYNF